MKLETQAARQALMGQASATATSHGAADGSCAIHSSMGDGVGDPAVADWAVLGERIIEAAARRAALRITESGEHS